MQVESAKVEILKRLKNMAEGNNGASSASESEFTQDITYEEPPKKRFHHLNRIQEAKWKEGLKRTARLPPPPPPPPQGS